LWNTVNGTERVVQPVRRRTTRSVQLVGTVRVPIAGPYRPVARLYRFPDGRLLWHLRLWEVDRAVPHLVPTSVLLGFARQNRLPALALEVRRLVDSVVTEGRARG
jgi:hypothetical protein